MIADSYHRGGRKKLFTIALAVSVLLLVGVAYDIWVGARVTPTLLRYVPPGSQGYVITGPLKGLWSNGRAHPFLTQPDRLLLLLTLLNVNSGSFLYDLVALEMRIQNQCSALNSEGDLIANGIDPTQGVALVIIDQQNHNYMAVVPTLDQKRLMKFVQRLQSPWYEMTLTPVDHTRPVRNFRIISNSSSGAEFCLIDHSKTDDLKPDSTVETNFSAADDKSEWKEAHFYVGLAESDQSGNVALACAAEYFDGSVGACQCTIGDADCSKGKTLPPLKTEEVRNFAVKGLTAVNAEVPGVGKIFLAFPGEHTALLAIDAQSAAAALDETTNFHAFQSDDSLRVALNQILGSDTEGEGVIFGAFGVAYPPIFGSAHFSTMLDRDRLTGELFLPWQTLEQTILSHIISAPPAADELRRGDSQFAEIQASDPFLGSYLAYFKAYFADKAEQLNSYFGNFSAILRAVEAEGTITRLGLSFQGLSDGVPHFLLSLALARKDADTFLLRQRQALRSARDIEILQAAAQRSFVDNDGSQPTEIPQLQKYLDEEPNALWARYTIKPASQDHDGQSAPAIAIIPKTSAADFDSDAYNIQMDGHLFQFISPAFTTNDQKFRLSRSSPSSAEIDILKSNRYRMVACYDEIAGRLLVSTDQATLDAHFSRLDDNAPKRRTKANEARTKLRFDSRPRVLYSQMQNYPNLNEKDTAFLDYVFGALGKYSQLDLSLQPRPKRNGLLLSWGASYE